MSATGLADVAKIALRFFTSIFQSSLVTLSCGEDLFFTEVYPAIPKCDGHNLVEVLIQSE
jgi:hypothetical protein